MLATRLVHALEDLRGVMRTAFMNEDVQAMRALASFLDKEASSLEDAAACQDVDDPARIQAFEVVEATHALQAALTRLAAIEEGK